MPASNLFTEMSKVNYCYSLNTVKLQICPYSLFPLSQQMSLKSLRMWNAHNFTELYFKNQIHRDIIYQYCMEVEILKNYFDFTKHFRFKRKSFKCHCLF